MTDNIMEISTNRLKVDKPADFLYTCSMLGETVFGVDLFAVVNAFDSLLGVQIT